MLQLCECCERNNEFLPVPERPFRVPLHHGMGGPKRLASLENWAQLHHRLIPEYMVPGYCKVIARLLGSQGSNPPQTPSLVALSALGIVQLMGPSLPSSS